MPPNDLRVRVHLTHEAKMDLHRLNARAQKNPGGRDEALLEASLTMLHRLNGRRHPTKPLDFDERFADLSDCDTTYVGADPYEKPPLRIVSRDLPPSRPSGITRREIIAVGPRQDSRVYHIAGQRLGRPVGVSLDQLRSEAPAAHLAPRRHQPMMSHPEPSVPDPEPEIG